MQDLANRVHQQAGTSGRLELARTLEVEASRYKTPETTLVVVGEQKRGKSALINALLGVPDLLPVDADVATNVHLSVSFGPAGSWASIEDASGHEHELAIPADAIAEWASESGNPGNAKGVRSVRITREHPLLQRGLVLVDTPGVGGLQSAHTGVTLATLAVADALLFVVDAGSPITATELAFLERAAQRIDTVIIAVSKVDAFRGWHEIVEDDQQLIAEHAPRFALAPIVPVSSRLAELALRSAAEGRDELAQRAARDSGLGELVQALERRVLRRADGVRLGNLLRLASVTITALREVEQSRIASAVGGPEQAARLDREQQQLRLLTEAAARWRVELDAELRQLSLDFDSELEWAVATLDREFEARIAGARPAELAHLDEELLSTLEALWLNSNLFVRDRVAQIVDRLAHTLELEAVKVDVGDLHMPDRVGEMIEQRSTGGDPDDKASQFLNYYPVIFAGSSVSMLAGNLAALGVGTLAGGPLVFLSSLAMVGMYALRKNVSDKTTSARDATKLQKATLSQARSTMAKQFARQLIDVRRTIESDFGRRIDERRRALEALVREQQQIARQDASERQKVETESAARLAQLDKLSATAEQIRAELAHDLPV